MLHRLGLGPVFAYEWLIASRRWQLYAGRVLFLLVVLGALFFVWWAHVVDDLGPPTLQAQARLGTNYFFAIIGTQLALVLLAAPAATAGSMCLDKARGTLAHLLVTDLSSAEIVLGKLGVRLLPVLGLLLCALPVLALNVLLGGVDPLALAGAFLIAVGVAVLGCSLALALSVWGHKTHEVLLFNYLLWVLFLLAAPTWETVTWGLFRSATSPRLLTLANPFWLTFAPYSAPGTTGLFEPVVFLAACLALSAVLIGFAILTVRPVTVRHLGQSQRKSRWPALGLALHRGLWGVFGPSLDANPVLWREWHRKRPSRWMIVVWLAYGVLGGGFTALAIFLQLINPRGPNPLPVFTNAFLVALGLLLVSVTSSTSLAEERVRGSLEVLLTTPVSTASIVWGKWWGAFRTVPFLAVLPGLMAGAFAVLDRPRWEGLVLVPLILAYGAALTSLGLALAVWIPRLGRAVACSVIAYVLGAVAWPFVIVALFARDNVLGPGLASGSPFFGAAFLTIRLIPGPSLEGEHAGVWCIGWTIVYLGIAVVLYLATWVTFDAHLGRVQPRHRRPVAGVPRRAAPAPAAAAE
jgi:ABC-type transport system involved in multi-copper enzyme maturation permease subunit